MQNGINGGARIPTLPASKTLSGEPILLKPKLQDTVEETLLSQSLVDESANHLLGLMKGLNPRVAGEVATACECAKQIQALVRLKLDVYRTLKGQR